MSFVDHDEDSISSARPPGPFYHSLRSSIKSALSPHLQIPHPPTDSTNKRIHCNLPSAPIQSKMQYLTLLLASLSLVSATPLAVSEPIADRALLYCGSQPYHTEAVSNFHPHEDHKLTLAHSTPATPTTTTSSARSSMA